MDWDCEVETLFRERNLGCKIAVSSAIDWFFENVEEGIILEDDCLPSQSFFWFCQELLELYRYDERFMLIGGNNRGVTFSKNCSYFFSKYIQIWGWATWRRSWEKYDYKIKKWELVKEQIDNYIKIPNERKLRAKQFDSVYYNKLDTWDFQWNFACLIHHSLAILPSLNMISNIGFGNDATHTTIDTGRVSSLINYEIKWPLIHPEYVVYNSEFERLYISNNKLDNVWIKCKGLFQKFSKKTKEYFRH
ncbi:MAG: hypothetical protein HQK65_13375 [Desulfamplus sp.]|nr:hypothetical protein [Desulfamplus sp.]